MIKLDRSQTSLTFCNFYISIQKIIPSFLLSPFTLSDCQKYEQRRRKGSWQKDLGVAPRLYDEVVAEKLEKVNNKPDGDLIFRYVDDESFHVKQGLLREYQETSQVEPSADFTFKSAEIKALPG